jgi:hypothetical protein
MWLHRVTPDPFQVDKISESNIGQHADSMFHYQYEVVAKFDRFGNGARRSDFEVGVSWSDVEEFLSRFEQLAHPGAIEIQQALKIFRALTESGWKPPQISN